MEKGLQDSEATPVDRRLSPGTVVPKSCESGNLLRPTVDQAPGAQTPGFAGKAPEHCPLPHRGLSRMCGAKSLPQSCLRLAFLLQRCPMPAPVS